MQRGGTAYLWYVICIFAIRLECILHTRTKVRTQGSAGQVVRDFGGQQQHTYVSMLSTEYVPSTAA